VGVHQLEVKLELVFYERSDEDQSVLVDGLVEDGVHAYF
jgi:hypothetical protein